MQGNMPLYTGNFTRPFSSGTPESDQHGCHLLSLLYELSSASRNVAWHQLHANHPERLLFSALQGWRVVTAAHFASLIPRGRGHSAHSDRVQSAVSINTALVTLLYRVYDMAYSEGGGIEPAMLMIIVRVCFHGSEKVVFNGK